jgi:amino acid transporter
MDRKSSAFAESAAQPHGEGLQRHFGLLHATALNVIMIVGTGVFITIPFMLLKLPGPYALLGWLVAGLLILVDGLIWSELAAALPGSGGSYLYLLECYGRRRWGRLMAFLFIWQFLLSGPLEVASGLISMGMFANGLSESIKVFNQEHTRIWTLWNAEHLEVVISPNRWAMAGVGLLIILLVYRRITSLGWLTVTFWVGVLAAIAWVLIEGWTRFDRQVAFAFSEPSAGWPGSLWSGLGGAMILAMYSYLGYYHVCYIGDEVRDPARTLPRAILLSALLVIVLFVGLHLAMLGTVAWQTLPTEEAKLDDFSLPAEFMRKIHPGEWAAVLVTLLIMWSSFGSTFAALFGYSRIPYGAARHGHFFTGLARLHPVHQMPHRSLLLIGGLTLFWSFFSLQNVIDALVTTRILAQFIVQVFAVVLLRHWHPERFRPYQMWLYPLPCALALVGWLYMFIAARGLYIVFSVGVLTLGVGAFLLWSWRTGGWPFQEGEPERS